MFFAGLLLGAGGRADGEADQALARLRRWAAQLEHVELEWLSVIGRSDTGVQYLRSSTFTRSGIVRKKVDHTRYYRTGGFKWPEDPLDESWWQPLAARLDAAPRGDTLSDLWWFDGERQTRFSRTEERASGRREKRPLHTSSSALFLECPYYWNAPNAWAVAIDERGWLAHETRSKDGKRVLVISAPDPAARMCTLLVSEGEQPAHLRLDLKSHLPAARVVERLASVALPAGVSDLGVVRRRIEVLAWLSPHVEGLPPLPKIVRLSGRGMVQLWRIERARIPSPGLEPGPLPPELRHLPHVDVFDALDGRRLRYHPDGSVDVLPAPDGGTDD